MPSTPRASSLRSSPSVTLDRPAPRYSRRLWPNAFAFGRGQALTAPPVTRLSVLRRTGDWRAPIVIANTHIFFGINKLQIRLFIPFVSSSLFRTIFDLCPGTTSHPLCPKATADPKPQAGPSVRFKSCFKSGSLLPSRSGSILASAEGGDAPQSGGRWLGLEGGRL